MWMWRRVEGLSRAAVRGVLAAGLSLVVLGSGAPAAAITLETLSLWNGTNNIGSFGEFNTATYGQVVRTPVGVTTLDSYTLLLDDQLNTDFVDFQAVVLEWDAANFRATGAVLFQGGAISSTNNGGAGGYETFTFATGGIPVTPGTDYVLAINASLLFDGTAGTATIATLNSGAAGPSSGVSGPNGQFVWLNNAADFSLLTVNTWSGQGRGDTAFSATFGTGAIVPEPATGLLLGFGLLGLRATRRR